MSFFKRKRKRWGNDFRVAVGRSPWGSPSYTVQYRWFFWIWRYFYTYDTLTECFRRLDKEYESRYNMGNVVITVQESTEIGYYY